MSVRSTYFAKKLSIYFLDFLTEGDIMKSEYEMNVNFIKRGKSLWKRNLEWQ